MCNFPAKQLLQTRRDIAEAKNLDAAYVIRIIDAIDKARNHHEDKTGCQCWYEAIQTSASTVWELRPITEGIQE
jgi:hypothetical protein